MELILIIGILRSAGLMQDGTVVRYGKPFPRGPLFEATYIDDHALVAVVDRPKCNDSSGPGYEGVMHSHRAYGRARIPRSVKKAYGFIVEPWGQPRNPEFNPIIFWDGD